jgi:hypothetical protein
MHHGSSAARNPEPLPPTRLSSRLHRLSLATGSLVATDRRTAANWVRSSLRVRLGGLRSVTQTAAGGARATPGLARGQRYIRCVGRRPERHDGVWRTTRRMRRHRRILGHRRWAHYSKASALRRSRGPDRPRVREAGPTSQPHPQLPGPATMHRVFARARLLIILCGRPP